MKKNDQNNIFESTLLTPGKESQTLILVRHGETSWNAQQRFQGQKDISLNSRGRDQAKRTGNRLQQHSFAGIYTSGLKRAQETAKAIASYHALDIVPDARFNEISFGDWEGKDFATIQTQFPQRVTQWYEQPVDSSAPGGETLLDLSQRVWEGFVAMIHSSDGADLLLVAHGGPLQTLLCSLLNIPLQNYWQFQIDNASISSLTLYPAGTILHRLNDTCHLEHDLDF